MLLLTLAVALWLAKALLLQEAGRLLGAERRVAECRNGSCLGQWA